MYTNSNTPPKVKEDCQSTPKMECSEKCVEKCEDEDKRVCMTMPVEECKEVNRMVMLMMVRLVMVIVVMERKKWKDEQKYDCAKGK